MSRIRLLGGLCALALMSIGCGEGLRGKWKSEYVDANGIKLHYWRTAPTHGPGNGVIVAVHGITDNGLCWSSLALELSHNYDLVLLDARGHGLSGKPDSGYGIETHAADLGAFVKALNLDEPPILLGHSMGGAIATVAASKDPELARALVLIDPAWLRKPDDVEQQTEAFRNWLESVNGQSIGDLMDVVEEDNPDWPFDDWMPWAESKTQVSPRVVETFRDLPSLEDYFPTLRAPTLIIKADAEEAERKQHARSADLLPYGKLIHIDEAGHSVHRDKPTETRRAVNDFLWALPLWDLSARYAATAGYEMDLIAKSRNYATQDERSHKLRAVWTPGESSAGGGALTLTRDGEPVGPESWDDPLNPEWLEFHRAADLITDSRGQRSRTLDRDGHEYECWRRGGRFKDGERIELWIEKESGLVRQIELHGSTRWTIFVESTTVRPS